MSNSFTISGDANFVPPNSFTISGDANFVPPNSFTISGDAFFISGDAFNIPGDAFFGCPSFQIVGDAVFVAARPYVPPNQVNSPNIPGGSKINTNSGCATCGPAVDCDPIEPPGYTLEGPSTIGFSLNCPPGVTCNPTTIYYSCCGNVITASRPYNATPAQTIAIIQALIAQCTNAGSCGQTQPPPGTILGGGIYWNNPQTYTAYCPDGQPYSYTFPGGSFFGFSQSKADQSAYAQATKLAIQHQICLTALPAAICLNVPFNYTIVPGTQFSTAGAIWTISSGDLPTGLTLNNGVISGTPTSAGSYAFNITVVLDNGDSQTRSYTMEIAGFVTASPLPSAVVGVFYSQQIVVSGFSVPFYAIINGALPPGLSMNQYGLVSGTPTALSSVTFTVLIAETDPSLAPFSCSKDFTVGGNFVTPSIFGNAVSYFNSGANFPAGTYKVYYLNGALQFNPPSGWNLNRSNLPGSHIDDAFWVVYNGGSAQSEFPGTTTTLPTQSAVESSNAGASLTFTHTGGTIGMYCFDVYYPDNQAGSPNPTFGILQIS